MSIDFIVWWQANYPRMDLWHFKGKASFFVKFLCDTYTDLMANFESYQDELWYLIETFICLDAIPWQRPITGKVLVLYPTYSMTSWRAIQVEIEQLRLKSYLSMVNSHPPECVVTRKEQEQLYEANLIQRDLLMKAIQRKREAIKRKEREHRDDSLNKYYHAGCNRNEIVRLIDGGHTDKEWNAILEYYENKCVCCDETKDLSKDHVIPVTWKGTSDYFWNLQPLCKSCNSSKGNYHEKDYRPYPLPSNASELFAILAERRLLKSK
jgi:5-methylcytosine-specific restriction endonuclease McrA